MPLPNKEANTVANAIFDKWYCRFGAPLDIVTDQGKEFCARLSDELFKRFCTNHLTTSPHHPQCNSQAEVANKTIAKYLASFCDDSTLDWELYLAPLMFSYNTSFHRSIKSSSFAGNTQTSFDDAPPAMHTRSHSRSASPQRTNPAKSKLFIPQVTFQPLPVLQEGEGLEEEEIGNSSTQSVTVNFVTGEDSWTLVQRRKKNKKDKNNKNEKWNAQQKRNFVRYGDIYQGEP